MCRILERKTHEAFIESQFKILLALVDFGLRKIFNPTNTVHGSIHCGSSVRISQFFRYGQDSLFRLRSFPEDAPQVRGCSCGLYLFYVCELLNLFNRFGPFPPVFSFSFFSCVSARTRLKSGKKTRSGCAFKRIASNIILGTC